MTRPASLLIALSLVLPSCKSVSLGGSETDAGGVEAGVADAPFGMAVLTVDPRSVDFGSVDVGATTAPVVVTVTNTGTGTSGPLFVTVSGTGVAASGCDGITLVPRASCTISITGHMAVAGPISGSVEVGDDPANTKKIAVSGINTLGDVRRLSLAPSTLDLGVLLTDQTARGTIVVTNTSTSSADVTGIVINVTGAGFTRSSTGTCTDTLAKNQTCNIDVSFRAGATSGLAKGSVSVSYGGVTKTVAVTANVLDTTADGGSVDSTPATGCDVTKAVQAASAAGLIMMSEPQTQNEVLPSNLSAGANWGVKDVECREGGYDLSGVAGKSVCLVSFAGAALCQKLQTTVWVVMSEGAVQCIYQSAALNPGIYSVHDSSCMNPDVGGCLGPNPALRTCRSTESECIPSVCSCGGLGVPSSTWGCTTDCRQLPLCADGGISDAGGGCSTGRIDNTQAATLLAQYVRQRIADLNPATTFGAEEKTVANLWDTLQAQLFFGKMFAEDGSVWQEVAFLVRRCTVTMPTDDLWFGLIESGVVANGAFYYSWSYGSGIYRSNLGKLVLDAASLARTTGPGYRNPGSGPPGLVVALENAQLVVYRATVNWAKFNEWSNPEPMGYLKDFGDRLAVVDGSGKEISTTLP